ncbi:MAG: protein phosphatase 1 regulatory subunit 42 [Mollicutes bacterium UO1]
MVGAQEYINNNYPREERKIVIKLDISNRNLEGKLELEGFTNLEELNCSYNELTSLKIINCPKISYFGA